MHRHEFFAAVSVLLATVGLLVSCDGGGGGIPAPSTDRTWYYEDEFHTNPGLVARPEQVVLLKMTSQEGESQHEIPYQDGKGGGTLFAVESDDPLVTRIEIFDSADRLLATAERGDGGVYLDVEMGGYTVRATHQSTGMPAPETVAFIRRQTEGQAAVVTADPGAASEVPPITPEYPAFVALQFTSGDYEGQYLAAVDGSAWEDLHAVDVSFMKAVPLDTSGDEFQKLSHLFSFKKADYTSCDLGNPPPFIGDYHFYSWTAGNASQNYYGIGFSCSWDWAPHCPASQDNFFEPGWTALPGFHPHTDDFLPVGVQDLGDGTFSPWAYAFYGQPCSPLYAAENGFLYFTDFSKSADLDGFTIDPSFAFYKDGTQINKRNLKNGQVALYEGEGYTGVAVVLNASLSDTTLIPLDQLKSVAFGLYTDTTVQFFSQTDFSGSHKTVGVDMPGNLDIGSGDMRSVKIFDSRKILVSSKKCPNCNLAGVDLSKLDLDKADLSGANLMDASLHSSSLQQADLSTALLNGAILTNANLSGASLYMAFLNGDKGLNLGAATLTGAYLKNANLAGTDLGGADFSFASFYSGAYNQAGCAQDATNPPFTQNCASAQGANMNTATFSQAYLAGADFSGATATAADFSGAVLTGANFKNTHLEWDGSTSSRANFTGAFIGGADFTNAAAGGAKFENAYVNFSQNGDCMLFTVSSAHTQFPGFHYDYGDSPCVMFAYSEPTEAAQTDSSNICPDGSGGPCDSTWNKPVIPREQSTQANSSCFDSPPLCDIDHVDPNW